MQDNVTTLTHLHHGFCTSDLHFSEMTQWLKYIRSCSADWWIGRSASESDPGLSATLSHTWLETSGNYNNTTYFAKNVIQNYACDSRLKGFGHTRKYLKITWSTGSLGFFSTAIKVEKFPQTFCSDKVHWYSYYILEHLKLSMKSKPNFAVTYNWANSL